MCVIGETHPCLWLADEFTFSSPFDFAKIFLRLRFSMSKIINLTQAFVDQKISEIAQKSSHPCHSAFFNPDLRQKIVVCILNQLKPNYVLCERSNVSSAEISQFLSEHEQRRIERLINNSIVPVLQEADALKYFPYQSHSLPTEKISHWFG
jgi:hypothetical protein